MPAIILCIEDEATLLADLCEELTAAGYRVLAANSVDSALDWLSRVHPDLILSDVMLGGADSRDGYFIHDYLRQQRPDLAETPLLFLTALGHRDALLRAKRQGIDDYLIKPVDYDILLATVAARLAQTARIKAHVQGQQPDLVARLRDVFEQFPGAALLCDHQGRLLHATAQAKALAEQEQLWHCDKQQRLSWPVIQALSAEKISRCLSELRTPGQREVLALQRQSGGAAVAASVVCLDHCEHSQPPTRLLAILLSSTLNRPLPDPATLRQVFALTPTEAHVALLLAQGLRTEDVAGEMAVSHTTVAFHLRNLFAKTCVTRQSELVALVLSAGWTMPGHAEGGPAPGSPK
jgi:DNA-binding NarL/FixJ family response regulator